MAELVLERHFPSPIEKVFAFVSQTEHLLKWWGPEGMNVPEHELSFAAPGPWYSVMVNDKGQRFKVSGQVTHVDPPHSVGFTWAWHNDSDLRGNESHVTIRLSKDGDNATRFTLTHSDLEDEEQASNHKSGWTSSLRKLEALSNPNR